MFKKVVFKYKAIRDFMSSNYHKKIYAMNSKFAHVLLHLTC